MSTSRAPRFPRDRILYFAYGSNLWRDQMARRCPNSPFVGVGVLHHHEWFINERRYANIAPVNPSPVAGGKKVWGLVYQLSPADEEMLDRNEGVPTCYQKRMAQVYWYPVTQMSQYSGMLGAARPVDMLIYIDLERNVGGFEPKEEYVYRMNLGIEHALDAGIPQRYVDAVMRAYIPPVSPEAARRALAQRAAAATEAGLRPGRGGAARNPARAPALLQANLAEPRPRRLRSEANLVGAQNPARAPGLLQANSAEPRPRRLRSQANLAGGQVRLDDTAARATEHRSRTARPLPRSNPQQSKPGKSVPQQSDSQQSGPQQNKPQQSEPQQSVPQQNNPQQSREAPVSRSKSLREASGNGLEQNNPQQSNPQQSNPQQSNPQQSNPQQSNPQQSNPQQSEAPVSRSKSLREASGNGLARKIAGLGIRYSPRKKGGQQEGSGATVKGAEQKKAAEQSPERKRDAQASGSGAQTDSAGRDPALSNATSKAKSQGKDESQKGMGESHS